MRCDVFVELLDSILNTGDKLGPIECPVRIAGCEHDALIPLSPYGARFPELVSYADFTTVPGVGHIPMYDDPALVAPRHSSSSAPCHLPGEDRSLR